MLICEDYMNHELFLLILNRSHYPIILIESLSYL